MVEVAVLTVCFALTLPEEIVSFMSISPACISALGAKNVATKAFFAITSFVLVGDFSATFAFAVFRHYKPPAWCALA